MSWLGEWIAQKTEPRDPILRERYNRFWAFVVVPVAAVGWLWWHFIGGR